MSAPVKRILSHQTVVQPSVDSLIADALSVLELEILRFKGKVQRGQSLIPDEGRLLNGYIKSLTELAREDREQQKSNDFSKLSKEEILELLSATPRQVTGKTDEQD